jgi:hypothetical protein
MQIRSTDLPRLCFESPHLHCERPQLRFESEPLNFDINASPDQDLAFHSNGDPDPEDPASQNVADPNPQPGSRVPT